MLEALDNGLERVGVTIEQQKVKMVGCNFDGAAVMMGKNSSVTTKLKERVGNYLVTIHCVAHCLKLAVLDTVKEVFEKISGNNEGSLQILLLPVLS